MTRGSAEGSRIKETKRKGGSRREELMMGMRTGKSWRMWAQCCRVTERVGAGISQIVSQLELESTGA